MKYLFPVPPKIISNDVSADPVVREGDNLTLTCDARGHPKPHIVWRREDSEDIMIEGGRKGWERFSLNKLKVAPLGYYLTTECCGKYTTRLS